MTGVGGETGMTAKGYRVSLGDDRPSTALCSDGCTAVNILKTAEMYLKYTKNCWNVYFEMVNHMRSEVFLKIFAIKNNQRVKLGKAGSGNSTWGNYLLSNRGAQGQAWLWAALPTACGLPMHSAWASASTHWRARSVGRWNTIPQGSKPHSNTQTKQLKKSCSVPPVKLIFKPSYPDKPKMPSYHIRAGAFTF